MAVVGHHTSENIKGLDIWRGKEQVICIFNIYIKIMLIKNTFIINFDFFFDPYNIFVNVIWIYYFSYTWPPH